MENKTIQLKQLSEIVNLGPVATKIETALKDEIDEVVSLSKTYKPKFITTMWKYKVDLRILIQLSHVILCNGSQKGQALQNMAGTLGRRVSSYYKFKNEDKNINIETNIGTTIINAYTKAGLTTVKLGHVKKKNNKWKDQYQVYARNRSDLKKLKKEFAEQHDPTKAFRLPSKEWENGFSKNQIGVEISLVKRLDNLSCTQLNKVNTPIVIEVANKKSKIAYKICQDTFKTMVWAFENKQPVFDFYSNLGMDIERRKAKERDVEFIMEAAEAIKDSAFYHQYTYDSRGRIYPTTAFLNEIGSDYAKGLIRFSEGKKLGSTGKDSLFHHIANMYGEDKLTHEQKVKFVTEHYGEFCGYGLYPSKNIGWMNADEPFQFLQACIELAKFDVWVCNNYPEEDFVSHVICYRDGSNNGMQWLLALARDDENAHLVNIAKSSDGKRGDFYGHVGQLLREEIDRIKIPDETYSLWNKVMLPFIELKRKRNNANKILLGLEQTQSKLKNHLKRKAIAQKVFDIRHEAVVNYRRENKSDLSAVKFVFLKKMKEYGVTPKIMRAMVKRPSMTYGYSATPRGMGQQVVDDTEDFTEPYFKYVEWDTAREVGRLIYEVIQKNFPTVSELMDFFKDNCNKYISKTNSQFKMKSLISGFPLFQDYEKLITKRPYIYRLLIEEKNGELKYHYEIRTSVKVKSHEGVNKRKSKSGIAPNLIHNLDALHLQLVVFYSKFDIVTAHDSYGSHACNVDDMQKTIRQKFLEILEADPIGHILNETGHLCERPKVGLWDPKSILDAEFAFS